MADGKVGRYFPRRRAKPFNGGHQRHSDAPVAPTLFPLIKLIQISLRTDAATHNAGYGGGMRIDDKEFRTRGHLTDSERDERFINEFEFSGCRNSLWSLLPVAIPDRSQWHRVHVSIELDNVTAIRYGRTAIGRSIKMSAKGVQFFDEVEHAGISISFRHVAGILNVTADRLSRQRTTHADWKLHKQERYYFAKKSYLPRVTPK